MAQDQDKLFSPLKVGNVQVSHRIVLAPLTRFRADDKHVPLPLVTEYYRQRASTPGTLLITEATFVSPRASGLDHAPGIWNAQQIAAWKEVTDAVHAQGSSIFVQLWALGRRAVASVLARAEGGPYAVKGPSAVAVTLGGQRNMPEALSVDEIQDLIGDYATAARNAVEAGFDGVELHGANGYLIDQFLHASLNTRTDEYGGSVERRSRFGVQVTQAVIAAVGDSKKVAVRLSPWTETDGGSESADVIVPQFLHIISELKKLDLAYLHLVESRVSAAEVDPSDHVYRTLASRNDVFVERWGTPNPIILAGGFTPETAEQAVQRYKDANVLVAFGRYFISTPDLPFRIHEHIDLNPYDRSTFYTPFSPKGYTDYPFSERFLAATKAQAQGKGQVLASI
ncbi:NADPH2 dehydrogenase [Capronia epimyces CBS 606.96]|uniref:NADPH2 dehydrogenase n=1 Tax=Capronia epimyces CBS 606.96 TaxID=1182542 RepID=W9XB77_9EURO|nr:NADPH2 dehydrogenase [Capronia epimyces CBS 606.96]EXJ77742.1 NADPH2 dehydrogenase [Capronia epimyces CBS 606.96]